MKNTFRKTLEEIHAGKIEKTRSIGPVDYYMIEKTPYSFHFYALYTQGEKEILTEVLYDLRNRDYFIKRNGREVVFTYQNLDNVVPREKSMPRHRRRHHEDGFYNAQAEKDFFMMVSVEENQGMYKDMVEAIGAMGEEVMGMSSRALVRLITEYNKLEVIYKTDIDIRVVENEEMASQIRTASLSNKGKLHQILGVTRAQLKHAREESRHRAEFINIILACSKLTQQQYDAFMGHLEHIKTLEGRYNIGDRATTFLDMANIRSYSEAIQIRERRLDRTRGYRGRYNRDFYGFLIEFDHPNVKRLIEYLLFESLVSQGMEFREALSQYRDYYRMSKEIGNERFELYPKYLKTYHDIVSRNFRVISDDIDIKKFGDATSEYSNLASDLKGYKIIVPTEPRELVEEGNALQHCIPSYVKSVMERRTNIMMLRDTEEEDKPLITVEVTNGKIVQARGYANRLPSTGEQVALNQFAKAHELEIISFT